MGTAPITANSIQKNIITNNATQKSCQIPKSQPHSEKFNKGISTKYHIRHLAHTGLSWSGVLRYYIWIRWNWGTHICCPKKRSQPSDHTPGYKVRLSSGGNNSERLWA